ncbi:alpha-amylase family glycosyl hydrolase [Gracilimonas mengyeensis]|uniref:Glycosidase n=1 Tax=Gracilimonas mengyeensis TaxID=1302730 RepID=A0A521DW68_9BACT|nr:alpha-amylase family glycosyl hydrolase [Gracilimonas mengyeensis]SMO75842.1 Glycosidase [Gracilimonas mengyeensis]
MNKVLKFTATLLVLLSIGCSSPIKAPQESQVFGLATPVQLEFGETELVTADYFIDPVLIDSVAAPEELKVNLSEDKLAITISGSLEKPLDVLEIWADGFAYDFLLKQSNKEEITITYEPEQSVSSVKLKGEMNNWNPNAAVFEKKGETWETTMLVNKGVYQYVLVVDGQEMTDPANPNTVSNGMGGTNSVLTVGNMEAKKPALQTYDHSGPSLYLKTAFPENTIVFWENYQLSTRHQDQIVSVEIPANADDFERSEIRAWTFAENGQLSNDVLIPLQNGQVITDTGQLTRHDYQGWNMYFVLIDRFKDGNSANTRKVDDPNIHPKANYYGGDFAGITQKIQDGYFEEIGVNTLWLSPITQNPEGAYGLWDKGGVTTTFSGYHGYWPVSSSKLDDRFGTEEEFRELLDVAHQNNMSVILDYVANHVHEEHPVYQRNPEWATDLYLPDGTLNTEKWDEHRLTTWFDTFMPTLDFSKQEVIETMTDSALFWVKEFELDGFRHDATKHIQLEFWRTLTRKIKDSVTIPTGKRVFQIGETYGSRELIASYINSGMLDSQFDFNIYDAGLNTFGQGNSFENLRTQLQESFNYYGYHNLMGYISGNHDKTRFITLTSGEVRWDEDGKLAGWTREIEDPEAFAYDRLSMFHAFNQTIPGIPVTYQGDEYGQPGANDPDNRRWMEFEKDELSEHELRNRNIYTKLTELRTSEMPLLYGDFQFHTTTENTLAYSRAYFENQVIVVFNKGGQSEEIEVELREEFDYSQLQAQFGHDFRVDEGRLFVTLQPNQFEILTL